MSETLKKALAEVEEKIKDMNPEQTAYFTGWLKGAMEMVKRKNGD